MMERYVGAKPNIFYFQTERGVFVVGTDDPMNVADASWFREFLGLRTAKPHIVREVPEDLPELPKPKPVPPTQTSQVQSKQDVFEHEVFKESAQMRPSPKMVDPMEVDPGRMDERLWIAMDNNQRAEWKKKWLSQN